MKQTPSRRVYMTQPLPLSSRPTLEQFLTVEQRKGAKLTQRGKKDETGRRTDLYTLGDGQCVTVEYVDAGRGRYLDATLLGYSPRLQA